MANEFEFNLPTCTGFGSNPAALKLEAGVLPTEEGMLDEKSSNCSGALPVSTNWERVLTADKRQIAKHTCFILKNFKYEDVVVKSGENAKLKNRKFARRFQTLIFLLLIPWLEKAR